MAGQVALRNGREGFDDLGQGRCRLRDQQVTLLTSIEKEMYKDAIGLPIFQFPAAVMWDKTRLSGVKPAVLSPTMFYSFWTWKPTAS